jgi:hypothetical protein
MSNFKASLGVGKIGEVMYYSLHEGRLEQLNGRAADFRDMVTGDLHELKLDTYDMSKTSNFFIEQYSDVARKTSGGPFRALENGCKYFAYMFVQNLKLFTFETAPLVNRLKELEPTLSITEVPNSGWITTGFRVNRELLKDLYVEQDLEVRIKK